MSDVCIFKRAVLTSTYRNAKLTQIIDVNLLKNFYKNASALSVHDPIVYLKNTYVMRPNKDLSPAAIYLPWN